MLERNVLGEESDKRSVGVDAKRVIAEVDGVEFGEVEDGCEERREGLGNLVEEATGEDVGKVGNLLERKGSG